MRSAAGLTQTDAAALMGLSGQSRWAEYENGSRTPSPALWEMFLLKTRQHPTHILARRAGTVE